MRKHFDIYDRTGARLSRRHTATTINILWNIAPGELDWAIEEYGVCTIEIAAGVERHFVPADEPLPEGLLNA